MIRLDRDGDLWTATIDRPDKANALTPDMLADLAQIARDARAAKCLVLTGTGRVFSAGADLDAARAGLATSPVWEELSGAIAALPCLTIAALNGTLAGGAMGMVLACDLRLAVPGARFFYPVMKLGFLPQPSDPTRLRALAVGHKSQPVARTPPNTLRACGAKAAAEIVPSLNAPATSGAGKLTAVAPNASTACPIPPTARICMLLNDANDVGGKPTPMMFCWGCGDGIKIVAFQRAMSAIVAGCSYTALETAIS